MKKKYLQAEIDVIAEIANVISTSGYDTGNDLPVISIDD